MTPLPAPPRRRLRHARLAGAATLILALASGSAPAQPIDLSQGGAVEVTAQDGIEWRQGEQVVIARGNARAVKDGVTVDADRLMARYRQPANRQGGGGATQPAAARGEPGLSGGGEIWRLEAEGRVRIATGTDTARGDRAVYDVDQAVMVLTGRDLGLTSGQNEITARDSLEYWSQRRMAVARGNAVIVEPAEGRRISADTIVAYFLEESPAAGGGGAAAQPARAQTPGGRDVPGAGKLDRVEAYGNVEIRTPNEVVRGARGVYSAATGMARLLGDVRITRGENQVNGTEAIVNMRTGVARLVSAPGGARVQGLVLPQQGGGGGGTGGAEELLGPRQGSSGSQGSGQAGGQR